jgi:hypothetical protein
MAVENQVVEEQESTLQDGAQEVQAPNGQEGAAAEVAQQIDPQEYERLKQENGQLSQIAQYWQRIENAYTQHPEYKTTLERMWKGLPPEQQRAILQQQAKPEAKKSNDELKAIQEKVARLEKLETTFNEQRTEALRKEKYAEVQNESEQMFKKFGATKAEEGEFWKRYDGMIRNEATQFMQQNPQLLPKQAVDMAISRHSTNLQAEFISLMEDKVTSYYGSKLQERNSPLRGIASPADKVGKSGSSPNLQERYLNAIKNETNPEKRFELHKAYAQEAGIDVKDLFRGSR